MDAVITYVNITDRFKEQYNLYVKKELEKNRFRSYDTLELQVKGIRKYLPYIKNIFIVVSELEQVEGLNLSDCKIITHDMIIPPKYLPCFNSCTIEMFLHKIPGLDEEFLYFNDDIFVIDNVPSSYWFKNGKPGLNVEIVNFNKECTNVYYKNLYNSTKIISEQLKLSNKFKNKYIKQSHSIKPLLKTSCVKVFNKHILEILASLTRTRHSRNFNSTIFNDYDYLLSNYNPVNSNYTYIENVDIDEIIKIINNKKNPIVCINDIETYINCFDEFKIELKRVLEANLKGKQYIREIKKENKKELNILNNSVILNGNEKIVISITSWIKRIHNCKDVIISFLNQSLKPDLIYLNLSIEEFPNKENDLPKDLVELSNKETSFIINWVDGPNTKTFKKVFPILKYLNNDDLIFWSDDDIILPKDTLKSRVDEFKKYGCPISGISKNQPASIIYKKVFKEIFGLDKIVGSTACSMAQVKMLKGFDYIKSDNIIKLFNDDMIYALLCYLNGYIFRPCSDYSVWPNRNVDKNFITFIQDEVALSKSVNNNYYQNSLNTLNEAKIILEKNKNIILENNIFKLSSYFSIIKPNIVIYSCYLNNKNNKPFPIIKFKDDNLTYIMYTDDNTLKDNDIIDGWKIIKPKSKYTIIQDINKDIKWHPFEIYENKNYDISIYVDSKVDILINPNKIILDIIDKIKYGFTCSIYDYKPQSHPNNSDDIYKHIDYLLWYFIEYEKNPNYKYKNNMISWRNTLLNENYPQNSKLLETAVVITNLHDKNAKNLENQIFNKYYNVNTLRDQIVVPYILWINNININDCGVLGNYCEDKHYFINVNKTNVNGR